MNAKRFNEDKLKWSLVDFKTLEPFIRVLELGVEKYGRDNWKKGFPQDELLDSAFRHLTSINNGELIDPESNEHHAAHVMCNMMFLLYQYLNPKKRFNYVLTPEELSSMSEEDWDDEHTYKLSNSKLSIRDFCKLIGKSVNRFEIYLNGKYVTNPDDSIDSLDTYHGKYIYLYVDEHYYLKLI